MAALLEKQRTCGAFDRLLVAAPPAMLGDLRPHFAREIERCIVADVHEDLTHLSDHEIWEHLEAGRQRARRLIWVKGKWRPIG